MDDGDKKKASRLPSFGQKNKFRAESDNDVKLPDPSSFVTAETADPLLPTESPDSSVQATIDNLMNNPPEPATYKPPRSKKPYYLAAGALVALVIIGFASIGIYATFFSENTVNIKAEMELRRARDAETLSEADIPAKSSAEMTNEERAHNRYAWYKLNSSVEFELEDFAEALDDRFISAGLSLDATKSEYQSAINARNDNGEKAYLILREADLIAYAIKSDDEENIALIGELLYCAEEIYPTIASANKIADWEYSYGSEEKSAEYTQLMYQRQLDENYLREIPTGDENE